MTKAAAEAPGEKPFVLGWGGSVIEAMNSLAKGRDVMALAEAAAFGWRAPAGTEIIIDEELLKDPKQGPLVEQARMRINQEVNDPFGQAQHRPHRPRDTIESSPVDDEGIAAEIEAKRDRDDGPAM
ncbi:hypothetical protein ACEUZ9_000891 [Paracoccus litorisediminis]|uniref:hypothetical protein n=1 Tax=Paracoccus litorisediminis TaxID=2006130 RepID=UPI003733223D